MNNLTKKVKILFIAGGVCLLIGIITHESSWYMGTLVFGIIGFVDVFIKEDVQQTAGENPSIQRTEHEEDRRECPFCAEKIKRNAKICWFCRKEVTSTVYDN